MSGTIPIVYGMEDRPFEDELNWNDFSINGDWGLDIEDFAAILEGDLEAMREKATLVWDNYFHMEQTDRYLFEKYLEKK